VNKKIQIIREHRVSISDERGSGRFCREMLTLTNQYFTNQASVWHYSLAIKGSAIASKLQRACLRLTKGQISISNDLQLQEPRVIFSARQIILQNLTAIPALCTDYLRTSALVAEFL